MINALSHFGVTYTLYTCDDGFIYVKGNGTNFHFTILQGEYWFSKKILNDLKEDLIRYVNMFPMF